MSEQRFRELGEKLHRQMDEAIKDAGVEVPEHPDDDAHNIAVGRSLELIASGSVNEGVASYNEWAAGAGYPGISLVSLSPLQVDIGTAIGGMVAELRDGEPVILTVGDWIRPGYARVGRHFRSPLHHWGKLILPVNDNAQSPEAA